MTSTQAPSQSTSNLKEYFKFDSDHLLAFCETFQETPVEDQTESILEVRLTDLNTRWNGVDASYRKLMACTDAAITAVVKKEAQEKFCICRESYYHCHAQLNDLLKGFRINSFNNIDLQSTAQTSTRQQVFSHTFTQDNSSNCIKLPPCDTEIFSGSYEQWPSFRDMFTAVYIDHTKLNPVTKLYHLRNKTRGEAGAIVKRYPLSHDNFELAWDALKTRYENKRVLVDNQIKILFDIPAAKSEDSESIRRVQSSVNDSLATLRTLDVQVESWDPILIRLISTKLPDVTLALWEQSLTSPRELPKWSQMSQFLVDRYEAVERLNSIKQAKNALSFTHKSAHNVQTYTSQGVLSSSCKLCNEEHSLRTCPKFRSFTVQQRVDYVFQNKMCNNCLATSHLKSNCKSKYTCLMCKKQHHTLLHMKQTQYPKTQPQNRTQHEEKGSNQNQDFKAPGRNITQYGGNDRLDELPGPSKQFQANFSANNESILLRTALVQIETRGELFTIRALIDPGSQRTFLTEKIRARLQLPYQKSHFEIIGIGGQKQMADKECECTLYAKRYNLRVPIKAIILPKVTKQIPASSFEIPFSPELEKLDLADPNFNKSAQIDLVLGNDCEQFLNVEGIIKGICGLTSAYNTIFGWVLSGPIRTQTTQTFTTSVIPSETTELNKTLRKFWELEDIPAPTEKSDEDEFCEDFYKKTTTRSKDGRYIVRLPFKKDYPNQVFLGSSRFMALAQYSSMEKTLIKDPNLKEQYQMVLNEYITLNHMEETPSCELVSRGKYGSFYLPHHAVVRPQHKTTKVRVVFNASRKTKSSFSLNDILYTGPTLQNELISIVLNWRKYKYVFSGDIQKMYRQIRVHPDDRPFQRILFQPQPDGPIKDYQLKTVTFGVNCAPYLAIRTLLQLASDSEFEYPKAALILRNETYVDDILSGGHSLEETISAQNQLILALESAGLPLKKITANNPKLLAHLKEEDLYDSNFLRFQETSATKTLGIKWNALTDSFSYSFPPIDNPIRITKRQILSSIAKLFDPAGWLAPIVIKAKILMQQLWLEGVNWDEEVSAESRQKWNALTQDLAQVEKISISRWIQYVPSNPVQIHGFSDASKLAYCAALYIRCQNNNNTVTNLLLAKSKVAPIQTVSLPRLELNGALLLAQLVKYVISSLKFDTSEINLWTDSSIALGWLSKPPSSWETYVANRTSQIHSLVPNATWRHVPTHDNPADLGTRGCTSQELAQNSLWWYGPTWLSEPLSSWPNRNPLKPAEPIAESLSLHTHVKVTDPLNDFSSYSRGLRVMCYIFRFFNRTKRNMNGIQGNVTQQEIKFVKNRLIMLAQKTYYLEEYNALSNSNPLPAKSTLTPLNPFIDQNSVLRVNGRLAQASLSYNERYPIILPGNSRFCQLYLNHLHLLLYHAECRLMVRMAQTEFYISRLKIRVKGIIRNCKTCIIYKQKPIYQIMAPLPPERCNFSLPFQTTGIDFAGPFEIKTSPLRKSPYLKGYVSVFVCFSTKAIHLEPCSDLTSAAFEAAFARFVGRRGLPQRVVTDNGRNFLGSSKALEEEFSVVIKKMAQDIAQKYVVHGFEWKFIPPYAPHMGGLWEAAVKSFKFHFKRIAGAQKFTFEEFTTVLTRIEGVLNSRPLSAISDDPTDLTALTPGHFLRGAPLLAFPEQSFENMSLVNRWEKLKALHHHFAIRWKQEYLKSLQKRYKWKQSTQNIQIGDLVVVMDDLQPPHDWRLGRVEKTFPGADQNVRTAEIRISTGTITRPIVKLCYLPLLNREESSLHSSPFDSSHTY